MSFSKGIFLTPGLFESPALAGGFLAAETLGKRQTSLTKPKFKATIFKNFKMARGQN